MLTGCINCNRQVQHEILNNDFALTITTLVLVLITTAIAISFLLLYFLWRYRKARITDVAGVRLTPLPLLSAAVVLGVGIGGFIDGIVFHQILQWHEILSNRLAPITVTAKSVNMFWDGIFHAAMLTAVIIGVLMLWRVSRGRNNDTSGRLLTGALLMGWGIFNCAEGIIDHHLVALHNVREITASVAFWNYSFLIASVTLFGIGYLLARQK
jgi:uncharacterized membrane protein